MATKLASAPMAGHAHARATSPPDKTGGFPLAPGMRQLHRRAEISGFVRYIYIVYICLDIHIGLLELLESYSPNLVLQELLLVERVA